jgi:cyclic 2,3-diphosphoglycerate synthetase
VVSAAGDPGGTLARLAAGTDADAVLDLADEPVVDGPAKLSLASVALHHGLAYLGPGLELRPQNYAKPPFDATSLAVIGTGKRCGKTAVAIHWARQLREGGKRVVIVSMGRGGPAEPEVARAGTGIDELLSLVAQGRHAASDYLEDAVLAGVDTVGCRRIGGGLGGEVADTNLAAGAKVAAGLDPEVVLFEGSGASIPAMEVARTVCVTGNSRQALTHLGSIRVMRADLVVQTGGDEKFHDELASISEAPVIRCRLVSEPAEPIAEGARIAFFTTSPDAELEGFEPVVASPNLARREALREDLDRAAAEGCDTYVTEIKAAAIELVAAGAAERGAKTVLCGNRPQPLDGEPDLDVALAALAAR